MFRFALALFSIIALTACPFRCMTECRADQQIGAKPAACGCCHHKPAEEPAAPAVPADDEHDCACLCCSGGILKPDNDGDQTDRLQVAATGEDATLSLHPVIENEKAAADGPPGHSYSGRAIRSRIMSLTI